MSRHSFKAKRCIIDYARCFIAPFFCKYNHPIGIDIPQLPWCFFRILISLNFSTEGSFGWRACHEIIVWKLPKHIPITVSLVFDAGQESKIKNIFISCPSSHRAQVGLVREVLSASITNTPTDRLYSVNSFVFNDGRFRYGILLSLVDIKALPNV